MDYDPIQGLVSAITRIEAKLDRHEDKFDTIVETLQLLVKIDTENKEIKDALNRAFHRVEIIEHSQNNEGCVAHKNFIKVRDEQLKGYNKIASDCHEKHEKLLGRIVAIENAPKEMRGLFLKGFLGALGSGFLAWVVWSVSQFK